MDTPINAYWRIRLDALKEKLEENNFTVVIAPTAADARRAVIEDIIPAINPVSISWGGSTTHVQSGIYEALKALPAVDIIDTYDKKLSPEEMIERRRRALLVDLFVMGTNALTEDGCLVNLDMIGNRVAALTFGPRHVVVLAGRNKIVPSFEDAVARIKNYAAPVNTMRLDKKTPCRKTGTCHDCSSPDRICNTWTITEKSFPKGRVTVILINEDLGF
ncbi:MAG: lactate utilization protein [Pseudomonadota bacterium]